MVEVTSPLSNTILHKRNSYISKNPMDELKEKIIHGDKGDGIPNILSPSDTFVRDDSSKGDDRSQTH